jgi:transposase
MYKILDKDIINSEILPHLSLGKRGFDITVDKIELVNAILYKLKTGCQWAFLPVKQLFSDVILTWESVYYHFRKWSKNGDWKQCWIYLLKQHKSSLDLSSGDIDGSHTPALRGGEAVAYQGRKKKKTTNSIYLTDRQGIPIAMSSAKAGNHHDVHEIEKSMGEIFNTMTDAEIRLDGLFLNADAGFDCEVFRLACHKQNMMVNVAFNSRNGCENEDCFLDEELYRERYSIERTNAWMDSYRSLLNRFDKTTASWESFNYIAFMVILLKKIKKRE